MPVKPFALASLWALYKESIFDVESSAILFNPYRDEIPELDTPGAAKLRRANLRNYLTAFPASPPILMVGEAPGPRGCRFTGVPFTSERLYLQSMLPFKGKQTSTGDVPRSENTATIFWREMTSHFPRFVIWNSLPLHPHQPGEPLSVRTPTIREVRAHLPVLERVLEIVRPERILAVGRVAQNALRQLDRTYVPVRHPSHGGATVFRDGVNQALSNFIIEA